ncbi:D-psicose/D-tagatose/L-ribulose 3-epimerase [Candidatus Nanopelagicus abundans]|uniref:D-psicose/D-tagatose/L-ribulose 3-epimerase n=1 Tax=Candidatus Nanopelagicus abundans TaxID=1884916 RepID=A0A249L3R1_9ACTN|nr:sugar phosphate isomerase/epimerase family protein [Candidatus Nanopelagicus abundans]ASY23579.1 D-psicose/D-tagatose/L-ribulose 3-epimerase [Candidatus Nanopelagicus abundans]
MTNKNALKFGGHALVWAGDWSEASARKAAASAKKAGYDYIEMLMIEPDKIDVAMTKAVLSEYGLFATASLGLSPETDVTSTNPSIVKKGDELLRKVVDKLHAIGSTELCGVIYCSLGKYPGPASAENRANSIAAVARLADYAADKGININLEVVNRYETNIMNTGKEGLKFLEAVNRPNAYLHLDTYHMNIEEDGMSQAVLDAGDALGYVHIGESHRGYLGSGNVDFDTFFTALKKINYSGPITFESFSSVVVDPALSNALCIWRNLWEDSDDLAAHALKYMKARY